MNNKRITINFIPQDSASWFFIAIAVAIGSCVWASAYKDVEIARAKAQQNQATERAIIEATAK